MIMYNHNWESCKLGPKYTHSFIEITNTTKLTSKHTTGRQEKRKGSEMDSGRKVRGARVLVLLLWYLNLWHCTFLEYVARFLLLCWSHPLMYPWNPCKDTEAEQENKPCRVYRKGNKMTVAGSILVGWWKLGEMSWFRGEVGCLLVHFLYLCDYFKTSHLSIPLARIHGLSWLQ